jgi:hypothetical protein
MSDEFRKFQVDISRMTLEKKEDASKKFLKERMKKGEASRQPQGAQEKPVGEGLTTEEQSRNQMAKKMEEKFKNAGNPTKGSQKPEEFESDE